VALRPRLWPGLPLSWMCYCAIAYDSAPRSSRPSSQLRPWAPAPRPPAWKAWDAQTGNRSGVQPHYPQRGGR
jgi:hypothetical protein